MKDSALDWSFISKKFPHLQYVIVSFEINPQGKMEHTNIDELDNDQQACKEAVEQLSQQTFLAKYQCSTCSLISQNIA